MATYTETLLLSYVIYLTDAAQVASLQAQYPNGIQVCPAIASTLFNAPIDTSGGAPIAPPSIEFIEKPFVPPGATGIFDQTQNTGTVSWSWTTPSGSDTEIVTYYWYGQFLLATATPPSSANPYPLGLRRWVNGFEVPVPGIPQISRDAARFSDGMGYAYRSTSGGNSWPENTNITTTRSGERFYFRVRVLPPSGIAQLWSVKASVEGGQAIFLGIDSGGVIRLYNKGNNAYPGTAIGTLGTVVVGAWHRADLLFSFNTSNSLPNAFVGAWLDGGTVQTGTLYRVPQINLQNGVGGTGGLNTVQNHVSSSLGNVDGSSQGQGVEIDFDDWISTSPGLNVDGAWAPGVDLLTGSHVTLVQSTGFGPLHNAGAWTGDWRELQVLPQAGLAGTTNVTSTTPTAWLDVTTDFGSLQAGCAALRVFGFAPFSPASASIILGANVNGSTLGTKTVSVSANAWYSAMAFSVFDGTAAGALAFGVTGVDLVLQKDVSASQQAWSALVGSAEMIGIFDVPDGGAPTITTIHNSPYPYSGFQNTTLFAPSGGFGVMSGTYAGNNLGQDILAQIPAHWFFARNVTGGATDGIFWYSSMVGAHGWVTKGASPNRMTRARLLNGITPTLSTAGPNVQNNATGSTYQWVAVSDPAMRFLMNGAFSHVSALASALNPYPNPAFSADGIFLFVEDTNDSAVGHYFRGPGHTGNQASPLNGAVVTSVVTPAVGSLTSLAPLNGGWYQTAYSAWRKSDGVTGTALDITSYVGNGTSSKTITVALNGYIPLFTLVVPPDAVSYVRDPGHTGTNSTALTGGGSTTAITAVAANSITVGTTLNGNGLVYQVFVIGTLTGQNPSPFSTVQPWIPLSLITQPTGSGGAGPWPPTPAPPGPLPSGCISFGTAVTELSVRLGDAAGTHWTGPELQRYLLEALRVYNALTQVSRDRASFTGTLSTAYYDLPTVISGLRGYTLKDQDVVTDLEYALLEPPTPTVWSGTAMFTLAGLTQPLTRRRDRFLWETGVVQTRTVTAGVTPDANGRLSLPSTTVALRRVVWVVGGASTVAMRDDEWNMDAFSRAWPTAVVPGILAYSVGVTPPLTLQFAPPPNAIGTLDTIGVNLGAALNPSTGVLLGIPDDFAWVLKWGVLADLLSPSGPAADPARASLCAQLWQIGIQAAKQAAVVLSAEVNGVAVPTTGLSPSDFFAPAWFTTSGAPNTALVAGHNLLGLDPIPDANGPYTVTLDVVRNQPVPTLLTDCYFVGGIALTNLLLDYAQFVALFKEGTDQALGAAQGLLQRFLDGCNIGITLDLAVTPDRPPLFDQTQQDEHQVARTIPQAGQ